MTFKRTPGTAADGSYLFVTIPEDEPVTLSVPTTEQLLQRRRARRLRERHQKFVQERSASRACYLSGTLILVTLILAAVLHPWHKQDEHQHHRFTRIREIGQNVGSHFGRNHRTIIHEMNEDSQMDENSPHAPDSHEFDATAEDGKVDLLNKDQDLPQDAPSKPEEKEDNRRRMLRSMDLVRMMAEASPGSDGEVGVGDGNSDGTAFLVKEDELTDKDQNDASPTSEENKEHR